MVILKSSLVSITSEIFVGNMLFKLSQRPVIVRFVILTIVFVQLLEEEMTSQQPQYEQFLETGHAILDKTEHGSPDATRITTQLDAINHGWDKLHTKLGEREAALTDALDTSTKYYEVLQDLSEWLPTAADRLETMPPMSTQPEIIEEQKRDLEVRIPSFINYINQTNNCKGLKWINCAMKNNTGFHVFTEVTCLNIG